MLKFLAEGIGRGQSRHSGDELLEEALVIGRSSSTLRASIAPFPIIAFPACGSSEDRKYVTEP